MPRGKDKKTGEIRGKEQTGKHARTQKKRYGKYAKPFKKGEMLPEEERTQPRYNEETGEWVNALGTPICGAERTGKSAAGPGICCQPAGWGTTHKGFGKCKMHGGSTHTGIAAAAKEKFQKLYGSPIETDPATALLNELYRTQGHVEWLGQRIAELENPELFQKSIAGMKPHVLVEQYQTERAHLVSVAKAAIGMGIAQKQVEIVQEQGKMLAMVLHAFIIDPELELTPQQRMKVPTLMRKHLQSIPTLNPSELPVPDATELE